MSDRKKTGWGLLGASDIAKTRMIEAINGQPDSMVVAVMSTSEERAKRYAAENGIPRHYASVEDSWPIPSWMSSISAPRTNGTNRRSL